VFRILVLYGKNGFVEVSKNLTRYKSKNKFGSPNNCRTFKLVARMLKLFAALLQRLNVLHNYFDDLTKLFSDL